MQQRQVTLKAGLYLVQTEHKILKSDGLDPDEYMHWVSGIGICYEDGALIGRTDYEAYEVLMRLGWPKRHKFYIEDGE